MATSSDPPTEPGTQREETAAPSPPIGESPLIARLAGEIAGPKTPSPPPRAASPLISRISSPPTAAARPARRPPAGSASVRRLIAEIAAEIVGPENLPEGARAAAAVIAPTTLPREEQPSPLPTATPEVPAPPVWSSEAVIPPIPSTAGPEMAALPSSIETPHAAPVKAPARPVPEIPPAPVTPPVAAAVPTIPASDLEALADAVVRHIGSRPPDQFLSVLDERLRQIGYAPVASVPPVAPSDVPPQTPAAAVEPGPVAADQGIPVDSPPLEEAIAEEPPGPVAAAEPAAEIPPSRVPEIPVSLLPAPGLEPVAALAPTEPIAETPGPIPPPDELEPVTAMGSPTPEETPEVSIDRHAVLDAIEALTGPVEQIPSTPAPGTESDLPLPPADLDAIVRAIEAGEMPFGDSPGVPPLTPAEPVPLRAAEEELPGLPPEETAFPTRPAVVPPVPVRAPVAGLPAALEAAAAPIVPAVEAGAAPEPVHALKKPERDIVIDASTAAIQVPPRAVEEVVEHLVSQTGDVLRAVQPPEEEPAAPPVPGEIAPSIGVPAEAAPAPPAFDAEAAVEAARRHTRRRPRVLSGRIASWLEKAIVRTLHPVWVAAEAAWNFPRAALAWGRKGLALQGGFRAQLGANLDELMYVGTGLVGCAWFMTWLVGGGVVPLLMAATFTVPPVFLLARQRAART